MKDSLRKGISFGLTSAVITTLGLMVGLHVSEEAVNTHTTKQIWVATIATFLTKFLFAMTFIVPVLLLTLSTAIVVSLIWGLSILAVLSYIIARTQGEPPWKIVGEHLVIAIVVIAITHWVGDWIASCPW